MLLDLSFQQANNRLPLFFKKHKSFINKMPYILFNTHHWQRATSQETHQTASLHNLNGYASNHSSMKEGQHVDHDETETVCFHFSLLLRCSVNRNSIWWTQYATFLSPDHNLQTPHLINGHPSLANHFWFQRVSVHFFFLNKHSEPNGL